MLYVNLLFLPNQQKVLSILKLFAKLRKDSGKGGKPTHGEGMKIGQVAQRYSISRDNLYYYINYGLLVPPRMDKQYVFDDETLNDLERILELKELGFTLAEIHHILSLFRISDMEKTGFREELRVIYAKRRRGCQEEIAHLERMWGDRIFEKCGIGRDERGDGGKTLEIRGKRRLSARDGGANYQQS